MQCGNDVVNPSFQLEIPQEFSFCRVFLACSAFTRHAVDEDVELAELAVNNLENDLKMLRLLF